LIIEDTRIGIKEDDIMKLFQLFGKLELENPSINKAGIGLGNEFNEKEEKI